MTVGLWARDAACKGSTDLMAMPAAGMDRQADIRRAKQVCHHCPVYQDCREWVLAETPDPTPHMITAGMTVDERRAARKMLVYNVRFTA